MHGTSLNPEGDNGKLPLWKISPEIFNGEDTLHNNSRGLESSIVFEEKEEYYLVQWQIMKINFVKFIEKTVSKFSLTHSVTDKSSKPIGYF